MNKILFSAFVILLSVDAYASVTLTQNLGANWVGTPTIVTASSPLTSKEGTWGSSAPYSLGQSFTATVSGVLTNIQLYGSGKTTANIQLFLYDMGPALQYANGQPTSVVSGSNSVTTVVSGNLFSTNLAIAMSAAGNDSVMQLTFSGADAVSLIGGHEYMFAMVSTNSSPMYWDDGGGRPYLGGAAYRQNSDINGTTTTDFSLAATLINTSAPPATCDCVVDWNNLHQQINGFGACSAWRSTWTTNEADMFFSTNSGTDISVDGTTNFPFNGIGLSLLRTRIAPGGATVENSLMQMAQARGATVWSTPWSPAAPFKSNDNVNGGDFLSANNQVYANQLAGYVVSMQQTYGIKIAAISVQNEPDVSQSYESCIWTAQQIDQFVPYLAGALAASNVASTKIILPEDEYWETNLYATAMMDPAAATNVGIVACHDYSGSPPNDIPAALPLYDNTNAARWETETSKLSGNGAFDPGMSDAMYWAGRIHLFMTVAQVNAWHYWWLISGNPDNEGLTDTNGIPAQRMYVLGQYSRFVHPGNYRTDLANYNPYAVLASAYEDPVGRGFAVVVSNTNSTPTTQSFYFTNFTAASVTPWITGSNLSLAAQSPVTVNNNSFSYVIPGMSVVTFAGVGLIAGAPPVPVQVPTQTVNVGVTLWVTNTAQDANPPLTWTMLSGPTNSTMTASGLFSWTPLPSQAASTNLITVQVTDSASLVATTNFTVIVNPVYGTNPTVTTLVTSGNNVVYGTAVTFTTTVTPAPTNGETVTLMLGGSPLSTGVLSSGVATYTTTSTQLAVSGSPYSVTAVYGGDGNYENSGSGPLSQTVTAATVTVASGLIVSGKMYNGTTSATISSNNVLLSGVVAADAGNVSLTTNGYTAVFASPNAGNGLAVTVGGLALTGSAAGNYVLVQPTLSGNITPASVTLTPGSGSLKITNNFTSGNNQFEVYNGLNGFSPALNGALFTNFQCDVRFAPGSATQTNSSGVVVFGHLQFGTRTNYNQDYFGGASYGIDVPATNTGWVHISIPISVANDPNLANIYDVLIHIYGPTYSQTLIGPSTLWVDNIAFVGPGTMVMVDQFNPTGSGGNSYSSGQLINVWNNWFGASWITNTWDSTTDAIGVAANNKPYDGTTNATITQYDTLINTALSGVLSGDLLKVNLSTNGYAASFANAGPGTNITVAVNGLTLAGSAGANYAIAPVTLSANISGSLFIPTATTLVSSSNNAAYGTAVTFTATVSPAPTNGETVTFMEGGITLGTGGLSGGMASYTTGSTQLNVTSSPYAVTAVYGGDGNYQASTSVALSQTVTAATVTVASGLMANNKVYDGTTAATINSNSVSLGGVLAGDAANVSLSTNSYTASFASAGTNNNLTVTVGGLTLTGSGVGDYTLIQPSLTASITPAAVTVSADDQSRTLGLPNPVLTASYNGFVNGEGTNVLTTPASLATTAADASPVGGYPITAGGAAAANYVFNYVTGTLTVVALPVLAGVNAGANGYQLTFPTIAGQMYQVEYTTNLIETGWTPLGDSISGTGSLMTVTSGFSASQVFFQLEISQPW